MFTIGGSAVPHFLPVSLAHQGFMFPCDELFGTFMVG
jgi:hypothetical protein